MWPNTYPSHEHRPDDDTPETLREAEDQRRYGGTPAPIVHMPLKPFSHPLEQRARCADALDKVVERYGLHPVLIALGNVCAANGIDVCTKTLHELTQEGK